jgi:hypothetical protein
MRFRLPSFFLSFAEVDLKNIQYQIPRDICDELREKYICTRWHMEGIILSSAKGDLYRELK